jgi:ACT domain-containing protein
MTMSLDQTDFTCADVGSNTVTLTVTDDGGNMSTCTATITVQDNINPTAICQDLTVQLDANGTVSITADDVDNGSFDNCSIASKSLTQTDFTDAHIGPNSVTLTVVDDNGNFSTCTATITVQDSTNPTAICQNLIVPLDANGAASITAGQVDNGSFDNTGIASLVLSKTDFTCADVGTNTVTLTVTDDNGNTSTCDATIMVEDNINPTAICQNLTVQLDANGTVSITADNVDNGSFDNCSIASMALSQTDFDCSHVGPNSVTLTVTDVNGKSGTCTATITVQDNINPTASCQNLTVQLDASGAAIITPAQVDNGSSDNCGNVSLSLDNSSFGCSDVGANTVVLTVTDDNGNSTTCTATITVEDNVSPTASCQDLTVQLDASGAGSITAAQVNNGSFDACGIASMTLSKTDFDCTDIGANSVTLTVTDNNGNVSTCSATITVEDNMSPTALCQDLTVQLDASGQASITAEQVNNSSSDNCNITLSLSKTDFTCSDVGTNPVTLTVTDDGNNVSTCAATITVEDNINPTAICQNLTVQLDANGTVSITADDVDNGSSDNCGIASTSLSQTDFTCAHVGTNAVTLTVTDDNGNVSTCAATITVEDNINPTAICQDLTVQLDANGAASITAAEVDNGSFDNCGIASRSLSQTDFTCADVGTHSVTLTITDDNGNTSTCTSTITVEDNINPTAICQNLTVQLDASYAASITAAQVDNGSFDNCAISSITVSQTDFDCTHVGPNTVTLTVTDVNGKVSTCSATITVNDPDFDSDLIGDCTDPDIDGDGALNENDSDDYDEFVCSDTDGDGCEDCQSGTYDPANDGTDTDSDGICDDSDLCSDPLANNFDASLNGNVECEPCPDAPVFASIDIESFATTMSSTDGDISLNITSGNADTLYLFGQNGAANLTITLPSDLDNIPAGYYTAMVMDSDGCIGVATLSPGGTTLQQPGITRPLIVPYALCCSGCGINDTDSDGICDDDDNCTDQTAPNYNDPANGNCITE